MNLLLEILHPLAGLIVLAESLNKLERVQPFRLGLRPRDRLVDALKALAWLLLALGAGGALAAPVLLAFGIPEQATSLLMRLERPMLDQTLVLVGFAVLIVRTRVKEG
ncbi:MAG: hypothetical protein ACT6UH_00715 [Hydrogenophaga sp.]|uniref:hypothetical protein n=1 Tax=Hydrogenophaga sp. TaxID=1904254 RepID=UPI0040371BCA